MATTEILRDGNNKHNRHTHPQHPHHNHQSHKSCSSSSTPASSSSSPIVILPPPASWLTNNRKMGEAASQNAVSNDDDHNSKNTNGTLQKKGVGVVVAASHSNEGNHHRHHRDDDDHDDEECAGNGNHGGDCDDDEDDIGGSKNDNGDSKDCCSGREQLVSPPPLIPLLSSPPSSSLNHRTFLENGGGEKQQQQQQQQQTPNDISSSTSNNCRRGEDIIYGHTTSTSINTNKNNNTAIPPSKSRPKPPSKTTQSSSIPPPKAPPTTSTLTSTTLNTLNSLNTQQIPTLLTSSAKELLSTAARNACYHTRLSYVSSPLFGRHVLRHSEVGASGAGYRRDLLERDGICDEVTGEVLYRCDAEGDGGEGGGEEGFGWEDEWDKARAALPPFSSLRWVDRQLVREWRTLEGGEMGSVEGDGGGEDDDDDDGFETVMGGSSAEQQQQQQQKQQQQQQQQRHNVPPPPPPKHHPNPNHQTQTTTTIIDSPPLQPQPTQTQPQPQPLPLSEHLFHQSRTLHPRPHPRPPRENSTTCYACHITFSSTTFRHHCRLCGRSYCHTHSRWTHRLPHLGYDDDVPERVCWECKRVSEGRNRGERIAWRVARVRDYLAEETQGGGGGGGSGKDGLRPYFEARMDTVEDAAGRITRAAIRMAKSVPMGAQATVAVETLDVLRRHGWKGFYGLILRKEFMAAADLLCRVTGINRRVWPLSVHELSVAVFYALGQFRGMRGDEPEREERLHMEREERLHMEREEGGDGDGGDGVGKEVSLNGMKSSSTVLMMDNDNDDDEDEAGDEILWTGNINTPRTTTNTAIDETDQFDPAAESVVNLLSLTNNEHGDDDDNGKGEDGNPMSHPSQTKDKNNVASNNIIPDDHANNPSSSQPPHHQPQPPPPPITTKPHPPFQPVCTPLPSPTLSSLIFYAPLAVNFVYAESEVDMQLLAAQQGWRLIYAHLHQDHGSGEGEGEGDGGGVGPGDMPASALFVHGERRLACFAIRGTATIQDVVTDIRAMPVRFPEVDGGGGGKEGKEGDGVGEEEGDWTPVPGQKQGLALCGMARAAYNLYRENIGTLTLFARRGYRIRLVGHSMGGSVAALMGSLVKRHFDQRVRNHGDVLGMVQPSSVAPSSPSSSSPPPTTATVDNLLLRVYGYGSPACVDATLSDSLRPYVITCVLHDDVVPRLTATSIRALMKHLLYIRETWVKQQFSEDLAAIKERAKTAWAPKVRNGFSLLKGKGKSIGRSCGRKLRGKGKSIGRKVRRSVRRMGEGVGGVEGGGEGEEGVIRDSFSTDSEFDEHDEGVGNGEGIVYEGDCFYEVEHCLIEQSDDEHDYEHEDEKNENDDQQPIDTTPSSTTPSSSSPTPPPSTTPTTPTSNPSTTTTPAVLLDETPLPRMFIPGRIAHIYSHRGAYKITFVPRAFRELRRISLSYNMINDHTSQWYYESLLECRAVRRAATPLPTWTSFRDETTCCCCASAFTWASTSDSEAQEARDKHNCRSCGGLVCDACSKMRCPLPAVGIVVASRVCDRCYNDGLMGVGVVGGGAGGEVCLTSSFVGEAVGVGGGVEEDVSQRNNEDLTKMDNTAEDSFDSSVMNRSTLNHKSMGVGGGVGKSKRNIVVDELAARVNSASFCV